MNNNFKNVIIENLEKYKGISKNTKRIEEINNIFNEISSAGFNQIVDNFCSHRDSDRAFDFLFEAYVCHELRKNEKIFDLKYEPPVSVGNPPDFTCSISKTSFDIQVKVLHNVTSEIVSDLFYKECNKRLSKIPKSLFFNYALSDDFQKKDINLFLNYIRTNIKKFSVFNSLETQ